MNADVIKRLLDPEMPYGEPKYSELSVKITKMKQTLDEKLDAGRTCHTGTDCRSTYSAGKCSGRRRLYCGILYSGRPDAGISPLA